jgi:glycosyltransferase involved in cell wall biosynthesis
MVQLSVIIITFNEAANIRACLESVAWADERIVFDSGSSDDTVEIARTLGAQVFQSDWAGGFGRQKNRCLAQASGAWVLSLDADERVTPALRAEIEQVLQAPSATVWEIPRYSTFCGKFIHHSGWRPDYVARLFQRGSAYFSDDEVHERLIFNGSAARLRHDLIHYSFPDIDSVITKMNRYSTLGAQRLQRQGTHSSLTKAITHGLWTFIRTYFLRLGFLDGKHGFILALANAHGTYYRYIKAMLRG